MDRRWALSKGSAFRSGIGLVLYDGPTKVSFPLRRSTWRWRQLHLPKFLVSCLVRY